MMIDVGARTTCYSFLLVRHYEMEELNVSYQNEVLKFVHTVLFTR